MEIVVIAPGDEFYDSGLLYSVWEKAECIEAFKNRPLAELFVKAKALEAANLLPPTTWTSLKKEAEPLDFGKMTIPVEEMKKRREEAVRFFEESAFVTPLQCEGFTHIYESGCEKCRCGKFIRYVPVADVNPDVMIGE